jgi:hypothetical protein
MTRRRSAQAKVPRRRFASPGARGRTATAVIGVLCIAVLGIALLPRSESQERSDGSVAAPQLAAAGLSSPYSTDPTPESGGRIGLARTPPAQIRPLFDSNLRIKLGETAMLRFVARDPVSGLPVEPTAAISASMSDGRAPERPLDVHEDGDGNYEVPFTPPGPGEFNVTLSLDGVPSGSQKVGVIGAAGRSDGAVDIVDPLSVDPRDFRARTGGKFHRR